MSKDDVWVAGIAVVLVFLSCACIYNEVGSVSKYPTAKEKADGER